jgi:hypothetical protein
LRLWSWQKEDWFTFIMARFVSFRLCLDWWYVAKWNDGYIMKFHWNGMICGKKLMEWNLMGPITFHTTQSFNFSFLSILNVFNGMKLHIFNIIILLLFYFSLPLLLLKYPYVTWEKLYFFTKLYFFCVLAAHSRVLNNP